MRSGDRFPRFACVVMLTSGVRVILLESSGEAPWPKCGELDMSLDSGE